MVRCNGLKTPSVKCVMESEEMKDAGFDYIASWKNRAGSRSGQAL